MANMRFPLVGNLYLLLALLEFILCCEKSRKVLKTASITYSGHYNRATTNRLTVR